MLNVCFVLVFLISSSNHKMTSRSTGSPDLVSPFYRPSCGKQKLATFRTDLHPSLWLFVLPTFCFFGAEVVGAILDGSLPPQLATLPKGMSIGESETPLPCEVPRIEQMYELRG